MARQLEPQRLRLLGQIRKVAIESLKLNHDLRTSYLGQLPRSLADSVCEDGIGRYRQRAGFSMTLETNETRVVRLEMPH